MSETLRGRGCLLTAATGGLGWVFAQRLAEAGCRLFLSSRSPARLDELSAELAARYGPAAVAGQFVADLREPLAVAALVEAAQAGLGQVDMLVNNAGMFVDRPLAETSPDEFDACYALNVRAPFLLMRTLGPAMAARGWGRIVNIGSSSAYAGFAGGAAYCSSKHALLGLSRAVFQELRASGVRVLALSPGSVKTAMGRLVPAQDYATFIEPDEVAQYLVFAMAFDGTMVSEEIRLNRVRMQ